ncbi:MAG: tetratricopeptide repeat protein [Acidobacteria bacterium]|nr:tetratricopeptide repeat protein [Acidobacteriota bacterium]
MLFLPGCGGETPPANATTTAAAADAPPPALAPAPRSPSPEELAHFRQSVERGVNFLNRGEYGKAAGELSVAVAIQPENVVVLRYLGSAYARDNDLERAHRVLQAAIKLQPAHPAAHYELAQVALATGDLDEAARESKITLELDPTNRKARELVGIVQYRQGALEAALETLEPLAADGGSRSESAYTLGLCYQGLERYEEARDIFQKVVKLNPEFTQAWFNLGKVLAILGDEKGAEAANARFFRLDGKIPGAPGDESQESADENAPPGVGSP